MLRNIVGFVLSRLFFDATVRAFFSARFLATLCTAMYLGTLGVSLVFMFVEPLAGKRCPSGERA